MRKPKKLMLFGLDSVMPEIVRKYANEGLLPNLQTLMQRGAFGELLAPFPTITPTNWATISTGAWPGTHGVTHFSLHFPGTPLASHGAMSGSGWTEVPKAERLWAAAERAGKKSILMKYSCSWPPVIQHGIQIDGCGPDGNLSFHQLAREKCFSTYDIPPVPGSAGAKYHIVPIDLRPAEGWTGLDETGCLEATLHLVITGSRLSRLGLLRGLNEQSEALFYLLVHPSTQGGYDRVTISTSKSMIGSMGTLSIGDWSRWARVPFSTNQGDVEGTVRFKLLELSADGRRLRLYCPQVYPTRGFTYPDELGPELVERYGGFVQEPCWVAYINRWVDDNTFFEMNDYQNRWMAEASVYLLTHNDWDLFFMQEHSTDHAMHMYLSKSDSQLSNQVQEIHLFPDSFYGSDMPSQEVAEYNLRRFFVSVDRMIGRILSVADEETLIMVVSDHGATASLGSVHNNDVLEAAGLLVYLQGTREIDWSRTKAVALGDYIYVNLKGRDPDGIVEPGDEYEAVRDKIIEALYDYRFPRTGRRAYTMAIRKEHARILGLYGDRIGDVVCARTGESCSHEHGPILPTEKYGDYSAGSVFIAAGPGIAPGTSPKPIRWLTDIAPTIAYLMDLPVPRDSEGSIMYEIFE